MSVHMRTRRTRRPKVELEGKVKEEGTPWREVAQENIERYTEAGLAIKGGRVKEGLTQKALAEILEIKPHHISEMENGKRSIGKKMAHRLAKVLNVGYKVFL